MKVAVIGSRSLNIDISKYIPKETSCIITGGAKGIDSIAKQYAIDNNIELIEIKPEYGRYGKAAPVLRNKTIIDKADYVLAFWNGESKGTKSAFNYARKIGKKNRVFLFF